MFIKGAIAAAFVIVLVSCQLTVDHEVVTFCFEAFVFIVHYVRGFNIIMHYTASVINDGDDNEIIVLIVVIVIMIIIVIIMQPVDFYCIYAFAVRILFTDI